METQIIQALVDIVKQGGTMALWGVTIYLVLQLLKVVVVWGCITLIFKICLEGIFRITGVRLLIRKDSISLLSEKSSEQITSALTEWSDKVSGIVQELEKQLSDLKKNSETKEERKTV